MRSATYGAGEPYRLRCNDMDRGHYPLLLAAAALAVLAGCEVLSMTAIGLGASTGIAEFKNGSVHRTFPYSLPRIRQATLVALQRMDVTVSSAGRGAGRQTIHAAVGQRRIEIELERLSQRAGRISVTVKSGPLIYDPATANEIVRLTEQALYAEG